MLPYIYKYVLVFTNSNDDGNAKANIEAQLLRSKWCHPTKIYLSLEFALNGIEKCLFNFIFLILF